MRKLLRTLYFIFFLQFFCFSFCFCSGSDNGDPLTPPVEPGPNPSDNNGGYLFAHMTDAHYGRLFYSVSRDGLKWQTLNKGGIILSDYIGHPDICKGGDGNYYMLGVQGNNMDLNLFYSSDLVVWKRKILPRSIFDVSQLGQKNEDYYVGAPKIFYDEASKQYIITWHASFPGLSEQPLWEGMRTCYVLTSNFETFTKADRLFNFTGVDEDMATIDTIIRKVGDTYYAIIKDERWPEKSATAKTIRIATSANLTGPYSNPGPSITPEGYEAPTLVQSMDEKSWYLYAEKFPHAYHLFKSSTLTGSIWSEVQFTPPVARHGFVLKVDEEEYSNIVKAYTIK